MQMDEQEPKEVEKIKITDFPENPAPVPDWDCANGHGILNLNIEIPEVWGIRPEGLEMIEGEEEFER